MARKKVEKFDRRILFNYLMDRYALTLLPKHFYMKLSKIFNGSLESMSKAIPPEHLYDMWVRKANYLDKVYMNNVSKGKKMDGYLRLNYDLSVIISKYDDYLSYLDRVKNDVVNNATIKENLQTTDVLYINIPNNKKTDDLSDILDDLI